VIAAVRHVGAVVLFLGRVLAACLPALRRPSLIVRQIYNSGARSLVIIMLCGLVVGMIMGLAFSDLLARFGSQSALGIAAGLALIKELGPLLTALLFAGRAGTSLASEIGLMRATDQLTAMQVMAVDPMRYVIAPRFLGGVIAMPLLVAVFNILGLFGTQLIGVSVMGVDAGTFWSQMQNQVGLDDVTEGVVKSIVFGIVCTLMAVYQGYHAEPTAEGVGLATTRTVIGSSVLVLIFDYMLTAAFL
jgi:phospholipid/cholesterol/gamma-HCH transport system permease protein